MSACRAFGLKRGLMRADYYVYCFNCRFEEKVHTKAAATRRGNEHLREMRRRARAGR